MKFAGKMQKYLGKPFREGATGPDAFDCVGFIYRYLKDEGRDVPDTFQSWTLADYFDLARGPKDREVGKLREWLLTLGAEIPVGQIVAGDLILVDMSNGIQFAALYAGNRNAITVINRDGVRVFSLGKHLRPVLAVRAK